MIQETEAFELFHSAFDIELPPGAALRLRASLLARLDAPSGVSSEFRPRLSNMLAQGRPASNLLPALALIAAFVLTFATIGVLLLAGQARNLHSPGTASSPCRLATPTPTPPAQPGAPLVLHSFRLSAPSAGVVWALVDGQYLERSTDRGNTWDQRPLPANASHGAQSDISFVSDKEGWFTMVGAPVTQGNAQTVSIWHTTDAGTTWQSLRAKGIADSECKAVPSFVDSSRGFLDTWDSSDAPVIYRTIDGGLTWTPSQPVPYPPGFKTEAPGVTLDTGRVRAFGSTLLVPALGWNLGAQFTATSVFRSSDGGATWTYVAAASKHDSAVALVTASRWIQLIGPGASMETTDAGTSWHPFPSDLTRDLRLGAAPYFLTTGFGECVFADQMVGYVALDGGLARTLDGGLHWTPLKTPGT